MWLVAVMSIEVDLLDGCTNGCAGDGRGPCRGDRVNSSAWSVATSMRMPKQPGWHISRMNEFPEEGELPFF
jgi:hypothetical protein